jgi:hypothetical protein
VIGDSLTLNALEGTDLVQQLERIRQAHGGAPLRVGVVGVGTEAKVSFLALRPEDPARNRQAGDLQRPDRERLRAQHLNALSKLEKILGVRCFESLAEFDLPQQPVGFEPRLRGSGIRAALQLRDGAIVAISAVRAARGPRALETIAQEDFVVMCAAAISRGALAVPALAASGQTERDRRHTAST